MRFPATTSLLVALSLFFVTSAAGQISLTDVPLWTGNDRFYNDVITQVKHPSLTLNGFDSGTSGHGLGLKQVLEQAYDGSSGGPVVEVYDEIRDLAADNGSFHPTPSNRGHIIANTQRMQARAFMALATYVMERNGEGHELSDLPSNIDTPAEAAGRLRSALLNTDAWRIVKS
jgi:hypothetical protein